MGMYGPAKTAACQPYNNQPGEKHQCSGQIYMGGKCECPCHKTTNRKEGE